MFKKLIAIVASVGLTSALFAAVPTQGTLKPSMTNEQARTVIVNACRTALVHYRKGDKQFVVRMMDGLPGDQQQMLSLACQAYSEGYGDGQHDLS